MNDPELIEVRCCCVPKKLLGWLPYAGRRDPGLTATWPLAGTYHDCATGDQYFRVLTLPLAIMAEDRRHWLAFKSEETPIEKLRQIAGFVENRE